MFSLVIKSKSLEFEPIPFNEMFFSQNTDPPYRVNICAQSPSSPVTKSFCTLVCISDIICHYQDGGSEFHAGNSFPKLFQY